MDFNSGGEDDQQMPAPTRSNLLFDDDIDDNESNLFSDNNGIDNQEFKPQHQQPLLENNHELSLQDEDGDPLNNSYNQQHQEQDGQQNEDNQEDEPMALEEDFEEQKENNGLLDDGEEDPALSQPQPDEEEGEIEEQEEEGEEEQQEGDEEPEDEDESQQVQSNDVSATNKQKAKQNAGLLEESDEVDEDQDDEEELSSGGGSDQEQKGQQWKKGRESQPGDDVKEGENEQSAAASQDNGALNSMKESNNNHSSGGNTNNLVGSKRKRGRPSKKDKLEQEMQQMQERPQKKVRFEDQNTNQEVVVSQGEESDGGSVKSGGDAQNKGGLDDYAASQRKNLGDFEDYVKMMNDDHASSFFEIFTQKRRKACYESLKDNPLEEERFNAFIEACPKKNMKKKLDELMFQLPGQKLKISEVVIQVITSAIKSHSGQLVELAKKIQIDEIKDRLAQEFPHQRVVGERNIDFIENMNGGSMLSRKGQEELVNEIKEMGPCLPHHMQEARRRLNHSNAGISDRPKSMFLRKRFR